MKKLILAVFAIAIGGVTAVLHGITKPTAKKTCEHCGYVASTDRLDCPDCGHLYEEGDW